VGAKVNGQMVPLRRVLTNGDQVEILRGAQNNPDPAWESFVASAKARAAIRRHVRQKTLAEHQAMGRKLLDSLISRLKIEVDADMMANALGQLQLSDQPALELAMARGGLSDEAVAEALAPGASIAQRPRRTKRGKPGPAAVSIHGLAAGVAFELGPCCHPVPGDRIVGVRHQDRPIMVHAIDCSELGDEQGEWLDVSWGEESDGAVARLAAVVHNQTGALAAMTAVLAARGANIVNLSLKHRDREFHTDILDIEVEGLKQLTTIMTALRNLPAVVSVERVRG
jgi:GTP pyrophosphokinase